MKLISQMKKNEPLAKHSSFGIGGRAELFLEAATEKQLISALRKAVVSRTPFFVFGKGTNVLFSDDTIDGLIIKNSSAGVLKKHGLRITVSSGVALKILVDFSAKNGLSGLEFAAGIPGTVGGAVAGNAGAYGRSIGDVLESALIITKKNGKIKKAKRTYFRFKYRRSAIKYTGDVILRATFLLSRGENKIVMRKIKGIIAERQKKHPPSGTKCAGSYFRNVKVNGKSKRMSAGELLDKAGAKGLTSGGASVSSRHANFIINRNNAKASDVLKLAGILKQKVFRKFGVKLKEEVVFVGRL